MGEIVVSRNNELDIAIYSLEGEISYEDVRGAIDEYYKGKLTKYTIWDFSMVVLFNLVTLSEVKLLERQVSEESRKRPGCYDILVVPDQFKYGLAKMYSVYAQVSFDTTRTVKTIIVKTIDEARAWIANNERRASQ